MIKRGTELVGWPCLAALASIMLFGMLLPYTPEIQATEIQATETQTTEKPIPACPSKDSAAYPEFSAVGEPPQYVVWRDLPALAENCHISIGTPVAITVALAAHFTYTGSVEGLAARMGKISELKNLKYWSVTDSSWRKLASKSAALKSKNSKSTRFDFEGTEVLSGDVLHFAQNDTRSWGFNVYSLQTVSSSENSVVLFSDNVSSIGLGPVTLFAPHTAQTVLIATKIDSSTWSYYSLAVIKETTLAANEKSLINRQAALHRFMTGIPADQEPPLAP